MVLQQYSIVIIKPLKLIHSKDFNFREKHKINRDYKNQKNNFVSSINIWYLCNDEAWDAAK